MCPGDIATSALAQREASKAVKCEIFVLLLCATDLSTVQTRSYKELKTESCFLNSVNCDEDEDDDDD